MGSSRQPFVSFLSSVWGSPRSELDWRSFIPIPIGKLGGDREIYLAV